MKLNSPLEYQTPEIYDAEYGGFTADLPLFVGLKTSGHALDLACGTGRLTIALAKSGLSCLGLDNEAAMLTLATKKSKGLAITYIQGDMANFQLNEQFDLITMAGNSFQALLTNEHQQTALKCIRSHLKPNGLFVFNARNPRSEELKTTTQFEFWHHFTAPAGQLVEVQGKQTYNPTTETVHYTTKRIWPDHETYTEIELRFTSMSTLKKLLESYSFKIKDICGDFDKSNFSNESPNMIFVVALKAFQDLG